MLAGTERSPTHLALQVIQVMAVAVALYELPTFLSTLST